MKNLLFFSAKKISCLLIFFLFSPIFSVSAETKLFSDLYSEISENAPETTAGRLSRRFGISNDQILDFVQKGNLISEICLAENLPKGDVFEKMDNRMCREYLHEIWERESDFTRTQSLEFRRALAATRFWDGVLSSKKDFDIMTDLDIIDRQFFGSEAIFVDVPRSNATTRQSFFDTKTPLLSASKPSGGCGSGENSLFGGISCSSSFCSDYLCVNIRVIPGRRAVTSTGKNLEASIQVIVRELDVLAKQQKDMGGDVYDSRNTNKANWFSQIFNWMGELGGNIIIEKRTPPLLAELVPFDSRTKIRKNYGYTQNEAGDWTMTESDTPSTSEPTAQEKAEKESAEQYWGDLFGEDKNGEKKMPEEIKDEFADRAAEIRDILKTVRGQYLKTCTEKNCSPEDVLVELIQDPCVSQLLRASTFEFQKGIEMCLQNEIADIPATPSESRTDAAQDIKKIFSDGEEGAPGVIPQLKVLWSEIDAFEQKWLEFGNKYLEHASKPYSNSF